VKETFASGIRKPESLYESLKDTPFAFSLSLVLSTLVALEKPPEEFCELWLKMSLVFLNSPTLSVVPQRPILGDLQ
jgi:hypothetical protein